MALDPLLVSYRYLYPIINTFVRQYRTGEIAPNGRQVQSHTVEDAVGSIGQALASLGTRDPYLTSQGDLYIRLHLQYQCYSKQEPPTIQLKLVPLQVLHHISSVSNESVDPIFQAEFNMIIIVYLFLVHLGEYTISKSDSIPFYTEDITFRCGRSVFVATAIKEDLQAATLVTLAFTTQKNVLRGNNIGHKASREPILCPKAALLQRVLHLRDNKSTPSNTLACTMTPTGIDGNYLVITLFSLW